MSRNFLPSFTAGSKNLKSVPKMLKIYGIWTTINRRQKGPRKKELTTRWKKTGTTSMMSVGIRCNHGLFPCRKKAAVEGKSRHRRPRSHRERQELFRRHSDAEHWAARFACRQVGQWLQYRARNRGHKNKEAPCAEEAYAEEIQT